MGGRGAVAAAVLAASFLVVLPEAPARLAPEGAVAQEPGVTAEQIVLGAAPATGSPVARGLAAYLRFVNARGGVHGRRVVLRASADGAFALAGGPLVEGSAVPQLLAESGARPSAPSATLFGPDPALEARVLGAFVARALPRARVHLVADAPGVAAAFRRALRGSRVRVVETPPADVVAILAPAETATEALAALTGRPLVLLSADAARVGAIPDGALTLSAVKEPSDPRWGDDPGFALYRSILRRFARGTDPAETGHVRGMALGHALVRVLRAAGPEPTGAAAARAARTLRDGSNPFLLPGVLVETGPSDGVAVEQAQLRRRVGGTWRAVGGLWDAGPRVS